MKKLISTLCLLILCTSCLAQERVIVDKEYYKLEYIDDKTASNKEYFGWALPGTAYTDAMWKVMRITYTGTHFVIEWADGNQNFDNIIYNYESLSYE